MREEKNIMKTIRELQRSILAEQEEYYFSLIFRSADEDKVRDIMNKLRIKNPIFSDQGRRVVKFDRSYDVDRLAKRLSKEGIEWKFSLIEPPRIAWLRKSGSDLT